MISVEEAKKHGEIESGIYRGVSVRLGKLRVQQDPNDEFGAGHEDKVRIQWPKPTPNLMVVHRKPPRNLRTMLRKARATEAKLH